LRRNDFSGNIFIQGGCMAVSVKLSDEMVTQAKVMSKALHRSVAGQIEYWTKIGKIAEENPDLTYDLIQKLLISRQQAQAGNLQPYELKK
jgi:ParD-like antitoxin of type II bacterial toxin-antitoxin system